MLRLRTLANAGGLMLVALLVAAPAAHATWSPGEASYAIGADRDLPIRMEDGTVLRADVYYPVDRASGERVPGPFPVLLNMTPYSKETLARSGEARPEAGGDESVLARTLPELVERGYINVIVDIRGTGRSTGTFHLLDPQQGRDGVEVIDWAAQLPGSNGRVGLYGPSYMAIIQYLTAQHLPMNSPLRAMLPVVVPNRPYTELVTGGGMPAGEADIPLFVIFVALPLAAPLVDGGEMPSTLAALARNVPSLIQGLAPLAVSFFAGGDHFYDQAYWKQRSPAEMLERVSRLRVPTLSIGGWRDVFQRGTLMNYAGHQNAVAGRPTYRPMKPRQPSSSLYQAFQGDWVHVNAGKGFPLGPIAQRWFDTWLKDAPDTGLRQVERPLRLFDMTARRWIETKRYPLPMAKPRNFYLDAGGYSGAPSPNDGRLTSARPERPAGSDRLRFTGASSPCTGTTDQYAQGGLTVALGTNPCVYDDRTLQMGPGALTYTTVPAERPWTLAGPIAASIFATSNRPDVSLIATLEDVSPAGPTRFLTSGSLLGSHRALDPQRSWRAGRRDLLLPHHPHTRAARAPVPVGEAVRYDIEIPPVLATIKPGHRLRLTLTSVDSPHITPVPSQMDDLVGGVYQIQRNARFSSRLTIPITKPAAFRYRCRICG